MIRLVRDREIHYKEMGFVRSLLNEAYVERLRVSLIKILLYH